MMDSILIIAVTACCTFLTRAIPFLIFQKGELPKLVQYLSNILPMAVIGVLVVYCIKDMTFFSLEGYIPAILSIAAVVLLHIWKRNNLISIGGGTALYMFLVQVVFK